MTDTTTPAEGLQLLRVQPQQARSERRLAEIREAARELIAELGRDRFTTNDLAVRAGCSIGTVYRYFADRIAVLDDLYPNRTEGLVPPVESPELLAARARVRAYLEGDVDDLELLGLHRADLELLVGTSGPHDAEHAAAVFLAAEVQL